jgi:hypothetical protein
MISKGLKALLIYTFLSWMQCTQTQTAPKRKTNKEAVAIEQAKLLKLRLRDFHGKQRKPLLIATFVNASKPLTRTNLWSNIEKMGEIADFAIVIYDGDSPSITKLCYPLEFYNNSEAIVHCKRAVISYIPEHKIIPKPLLYPDLLHYLPDYNRTMLIDEDISLVNFNYTEFMTLWDCAFYPLQPPVIVQGLVTPRTQAWNFVHWSTWKRGNRSHVMASATDFIEQQIPAFDSLFLMWFIEHVMSYTYPNAVKHETDWGSDGFWCAAARPFANHIYRVKHPSKYIPCALIAGTSPFQHLNTKALPKSKTKYLKSGKLVTSVWRRLFPSWDADWEDPAFEQFGYPRSYGIHRNCTLRHGPIE